MILQETLWDSYLQESFPSSASCFGYQNLKLNKYLILYAY